MAALHYIKVILWKNVLFTTCMFTHVCCWVSSKWVLVLWFVVFFLQVLREDFVTLNERTRSGCLFRVNVKIKSEFGFSLSWGFGRRDRRHLFLWDLETWCTNSFPRYLLYLSVLRKPITRRRRRRTRRRRSQTLRETEEDRGFTIWISR